MLHRGGSGRVGYWRMKRNSLGREEHLRHGDGVSKTQACRANGKKHGGLKCGSVWQTYLRGDWRETL